MLIGDFNEFKQQQLSKVEKRKKEEKRIKKGIYQMHVMVNDQCMETFMKEQKKTEAKGDEPNTKDDHSKPENPKNSSQKTDAQTEMERMLSTGIKIASGIGQGI